jgi:hypothetical protein
MLEQEPLGSGVWLGFWVNNQYANNETNVACSERKVDERMRERGLCLGV